MMVTATARETASTVSPHKRTTVSARALAGCVGLLVGVSGAQAAGPVNTGARPLDRQAAAVASEVNPVRSGQIVVRTTDGDALRQAVSTIAEQIPGVAVERQLDSEGKVFLVTAPDARSAVRVQNLLRGESFIGDIQLDQPRTNPMRDYLLNRRQERLQQRIDAIWPGAGPLPADLPYRGGLGVDPLNSSQWHFINSGNINRDNNIPPTIYTTDGLSGEGIDVGISGRQLNSHLDTDHTQLDGNYDPDLSMAFDPTFPDDITMTALAGIVAAELDGVSIQGVAPNAGIGTYRWSLVPETTPLLEFNAFDWMTDEIEIKLYETFTHYTLPVQSYNPNTLTDYVLEPLHNSFLWGRNRRGTINIFGAGPGLDLTLPDPYTYPHDPGLSTFSPVDVWASGNVITNGVDNGWASGPFYPNGQLTYYPPANDRRSFIFNTVDENGQVDIFSAQGPSVFASFYGGTVNQLTSGGQGVSGRGVLTTYPGAGNINFFPSSATLLGSEPMTGPAIGAGVIALMLEANPNLSIRDIQHILFESIQDSTKPANIKWPNYDPLRAYYFYPYFGDTPPLRGFWQVNSGLYSSDTVTNQAIRHSDQYGFGMVDAQVAIEKAASWDRQDTFLVLDTGFVGSFNDDSIDTEDEVDIEIPDATWSEPSPEPDGSTGQEGAANIIIANQAFPILCVRQNIKIEAVVLELTIENGSEIAGPSNDLYIELTSPNGTRSIMLMPMTANTASGTSDDMVGNDDETDLSFSGVIVNGQGYSLYRHSFLSWKHWGELSGGEWTFNIVDYGPNEPNPEGEEPGDDPSMEPGANMVIGLGELGLPGSEFREEHVLTGYRFRIYGTDIGEPIFEGCDPFTTSCPADLNGDGIINVEDLQIFIDWYMGGDARADLDDDGAITYADLLLFRGIWVPGYCDGDPGLGGRPRPGGSNVGGDNNPGTRPI